MAYTYINFTTEDSVAKIVLNRPDKLNSITRAMALEIQEALNTCSNDNHIRCLLLTGAGKAFCAGQDLEETSNESGKPGYELGETVRNSYNPIITGIRQLEKPVVCAVNGVAAGAGVNIALACDFVLASSDASFIQSFCNIGLIPDSGGTFFVPRLLGLAQTNRLLMLGEKISAAEAHEIGLIYKTYASGKLIGEAKHLAIHLADMPTRALGLIKRGLNCSIYNGLPQQLELEARLQSEAGKTKDYREGVTAFIEKRKPRFKGE